MNFSIGSKNEGMTAAITKISENNGIAFYQFTAEFDVPQIPSEITISFATPIVDTYITWDPSNMFNRSLATNWLRTNITSRIASQMPLKTLVSIGGKNTITVALSDAKTLIQIESGVCEYHANIKWDIKFFTIASAPVKSYSTVIRIDTRGIDFCDAIRDTVTWWETKCGYTPAYVPEHAKLPMNSLWYSYHKNLDVEDILRECKLTKQLGMETVIIDDGWQTDDTGGGFIGGYKYCGDWQASKVKIPDMKDFIRRIHDTGMKVMLWYSVPFIGIATKAYNRFKDMLLDETGDCQTYFAIDPRYKECRDYLIEIYANALSEWKLDGMKLDFIDFFWLKGKSLEYDERRDIHSLEAAVERLMTDVYNRLRQINPEVLIEFRQDYVGPAIRQFGTMLRVGDCPNDALCNRVAGIDMRLTSGNTAVHSDMLMWNPDDTPESAALQFIAALYCVPQISVKIATLPESHKKMLAFYLDFWRENRDILLNGKLKATNPASMYSKISAEKDDNAIITTYAPLIQNVDGYKKVTIVNACSESPVILKNAKGKVCKVLDCMGTVLSSQTVECDLWETNIPLSGMAIVE